jgi:hypothetical protein
VKVLLIPTDKAPTVISVAKSNEIWRVIGAKSERMVDYNFLPKNYGLIWFDEDATEPNGLAREMFSLLAVYEDDGPAVALTNREFNQLRGVVCVTGMLKGRFSAEPQDVSVNFANACIVRHTIHQLRGTEPKKEMPVVANADSSPKKQISLPDFLTSKQIQQVIEMHQLASPGTFAKNVAEKIIQPNIAEINRKLGQENDPLYLAYVCEYVLSKAAQA